MCPSFIISFQFGYFVQLFCQMKEFKTFFWQSSNSFSPIELKIFEQSDLSRFKAGKIAAMKVCCLMFDVCVLMINMKVAPRKLRHYQLRDLQSCASEILSLPSEIEPSFLCAPMQIQFKSCSAIESSRFCLKVLKWFVKKKE